MGMVCKQTGSAVRVRRVRPIAGCTELIHQERACALRELIGADRSSILHPIQRIEERPYVGPGARTITD